MLDRRLYFAAISISIAAVIGAEFLLYRNLQQQQEQVGALNQRLEEIERTMQASLAEIISEQESQKRQLAKPQIVRREIIREKSQEEFLTAAVARVVPAVVSIVVTKDVPELEVVYENPFGEDPLFKDVPVRIPRYRVVGSRPQKVGSASGFFIRSDGYLVTNRHVVNDNSAIHTVLLANGTQQTAEVVYRDPDMDVAILKISGSGYQAITLGNSDILKLGQSVFAIGNALGEYSNSVSVGIISGLNRTVEATGPNGLAVKLPGVIQTDTAINPGNSGGPLTDFQGRAVGVNVATVVGSNSISFAIPIAAVKAIIASVLP